jgi:conjugal transfer pilus assembly protein TraV
VNAAAMHFRAVSAVLTLSATCLLSGCANLSGVGGATEFACKAPEGIPCMSMDGVYANVRAGNLAGKDNGERLGRPAAGALDTADKSNGPNVAPQLPSSGFNGAVVAIAAPGPLGTAAAAQPGAYGPISPGVMNAIATGVPLRTPERILRVWIAAMEDADGVLHDQRYLYVPVERGRWQVETFLEAGARTFEPVTRLPTREADRLGAVTGDPSQAASANVRRDRPAAAPFQQQPPTAATPPANRLAGDGGDE